MTTILVVEDNKINCKYLVKLLESAHYQTLSASDAEEGLRITHEKHPDLIISDIMMPNMDGYEFVYKLRSFPDLVNTKVIFYTATYFEDTAIELAKGCGVSHYMLKPSDPDTILATVAAALKEPNQPLYTKPISILRQDHHKFITNKLFKETNELALLNQQLERRVAEKTEQLEQANQQLKALSLRDALTGLYNRRYLDERLDEEIKRVKRNQHKFAILLLDIDHYKTINDIFGHGAGDLVLQEVSHCLQKKVRQGDIVCRYGGDEFIVVLLDTEASNALQHAERIRKAIEQLEIRYNQQKLGTLTISIGVAICPTHGKTRKALINAADMAMYKAKDLGRDQVVITGEV